MPILEKTVEKMHAMLLEMYEDHQKYLTRSELTDTSTGKRKMSTKDVIEEEANREEGETSLSVEIRTGQDQIKFKKLKMSVFSAEDTDGRFYQTEHYFQLHLLNEEEKLKIVVVSLKGKGLSWFHWAENGKRFRSWKELKERMYHRFRCREKGTRCVRLFAFWL